MITGKLRIMGQIDVVELDQPSGKFGYERALLIEFDSDDEIRQALKDDGCRFIFGDQDAETQPMKFQVQELRPEVLAFALLMEQRLREKDADKGQRWKQRNAQELRVPLLLKVHMLDQSLTNPEYLGKQANDLKHATDLANYCMMIADVVGALKPEEAVNNEPLEIPAFLRAYRDE